MEQMQQKEEGSLKVQTIPQKELEQACFHALGLITRNCEYLEQHLAHTGADAESCQAVADIGAATARLDRTVNEIMALLEYLRTEELPQLSPMDLCELLQQLAQIHRRKLRQLLCAEIFQQGHDLVDGAVQPCRGRADVRHCLAGLCVRPGMCKMLFQIFAIARDQPQRMKAGLFQLFLRDRLNLQRTFFFLLHLLHRGFSSQTVTGLPGGAAGS